MPQARYTKVGLPRPTVLALAFVMLLGMIAAAAAPAAAQPVGPFGPGRGLLPRPFPVGSGAASAPKQSVEVRRPARTGSVASMKLLAPNVGWAMSMRRLMWTSSGGSDWRDITPPNPNDGNIADIFFLDARHGWVLLAHGEPDSPSGLQLDLATTDDSGAAWSVEPCGSNSGVESLTFVDPSHGWLAFYGGRNSMSSGYGTIQATSDGGRSWGPTNLRNHFHHQSPSGPMLMITQQFGWMVAGGDRLYVTRDGAKTWQRIELESPVKTDLMRKYDRNFEQFESSFQGLPPAAAKLARERAQAEDNSYAAYGLPTFEDSKHGYVCVTYPGVVVLFATEDGGVTWKPDRVLTGLQEAQTGAVVNKTTTPG